MAFAAEALQEQSCNASSPLHQQFAATTVLGGHSYGGGEVFVALDKGQQYNLSTVVGIAVLAPGVCPVRLHTQYSYIS